MLTLFFVWSFIIFGLLQTQVFSHMLRGVAKQLAVLFAVPGLLVVLSLLVDAFTTPPEEEILIR